MHLRRLGAQSDPVAVATVLWKLWSCSILAYGQGLVKICSECLVLVACKDIFGSSVPQSQAQREPYLWLDLVGIVVLQIKSIRFFLTVSSFGLLKVACFVSSKCSSQLLLIFYISKQGNVGVWSCEWNFSNRSRRPSRHRSVLWWLQPYKALERLQQAALHT